jgi:hypothetical protein
MMVQSDEMGITCSTCEREEMDTDYRFDHLGVDGRIIL